MSPARRARYDQTSNAERCENWAGSAVAPPAFLDKFLQCLSRSAQFIHLCIESFDPGLCQLLSSCAVLTRIQLDQLFDLLQAESGGLRLPNEPEPTQIVRAVASNTDVPRWGLNEPFPLIVADCFDADAPASRELRNGE